MHSTTTCAFFYSLSLFLVTTTAQDISSCVDSIYQFGDSLSDAGNLALLDDSCAAALPPYGMTFPGHPTGRWSNGRNIIDYMAMALNLPPLPPYLKKEASSYGVNFAIAAATALDTSFFTERCIETLNISNPLNGQIDWFEKYVNSTPSICPTSTARFSRALFMLGEIGINDINFALARGKSLEEVMTYVPYIIGAITKGARRLISLGAVRIAVPGNVPIGCLASYLTSYPSSDSNGYDELGCLKNYNDLAVLQNTYLQLALNLLREEFPEVTIIYVDYYEAFLSLTRATSDRNQRLSACCGIGGKYNYNSSEPCGIDVPVCSNPDEYVNWDGNHATQKIYSEVANITTAAILSKIPCPQISTE